MPSFWRGKKKPQRSDEAHLIENGGESVRSAQEANPNVETVPQDLRDKNVLR